MLPLRRASMPTPQAGSARARALLLLLALAVVLAAAPAQAQLAISVHLTLGNPSGAVVDPAAPDNYLIVRDQYALAYQRDRGIPRWVSWHLDSASLGTADRYTGNFITDTSLPVGWYRVTHDDYTNSGYDRGHMTPSADRSASDPDNEATFILTNIIPQAPANNRGPWRVLEEATRDLVGLGNEVFVISGGLGTRGTLAAGKLDIPAATWKVLLALPAGDNDVSRVTTSTTVIAVRMPNDDTVGSSWQSYQTSVDCIEAQTGLDFFSEVEDTVEATIEAQGGVCFQAFLPSVVVAGTPPEPQPEPVVEITEVLADPAGDDVAGEYVRIRNSGSVDAVLTGWTLRDLAGTTYTFPTFTLAPGGEVLVWVKAGTDDGGNLYWGRSQAVWNNTGDSAILSDQNGAEIDRFTY
jgi:endonuclease G, mitochondrial